MKALLGIILLLIVVPNISAQEMTSPSYRLELEQIESTNEAKIDTLSPKQLKQFSEEGFIINTPKNKMLHFSISATVLNFNDITNERSQTNSFLLTIASLDEYGYQIISQAAQKLITVNGEEIPPTTCDSKGNTCTPQSAKEWTSQSANGWGYHMSGLDSPSDFKNEKYYRPFKTESWEVISKQGWVDSQRTSKMTIKVKTSAEQSDGNYNASIKLIALPSL